MPLGGTLLVTAGVTVVAVVVTFGIARARKRYDTIDTFWGSASRSSRWPRSRSATGRCRCGWW